VHGLHEEQVKQIKRALATGLFHPSELGVFSACYPALAHTYHIIYSYAQGAYTSSLCYVTYLQLACMVALNVIAYNALEECGQVFLCPNARATFLSLALHAALLVSCFTFARECFCGSRCMQCAQNYFVLSSKCALHNLCCLQLCVLKRACKKPVLCTCADTKTVSGLVLHASENDEKKLIFKSVCSYEKIQQLYVKQLEKSKETRLRSVVSKFNFFIGMDFQLHNKIQNLHYISLICLIAAICHLLLYLLRIPQKTSRPLHKIHRLQQTHVRVAQYPRRHLQAANYC
jgi:hypothetical protein